MQCKFKWIILSIKIIFRQIVSRKEVAEMIHENNLNEIVSETKTGKTGLDSHDVSPMEEENEVPVHVKVSPTMLLLISVVIVKL